jgi:uncharacterized lipoprotein YddW (UPF0748 family)
MRFSLSVYAAILLLIITHTGMSQLPPKREFRGIWLTTVGNGDWPSAPGLSTATQKEQLVTFLDRLHDVGINVVFLQVRPECDALYASSLEPWSYWLTGVQGAPPSTLYDPLEFAVSEAHKRGMELHAWLNPYRAIRSGSSYTKAANHISNTHPEWLLTIGTNVILDPGKSVVRSYVLNVIADVVRRYDIDGVVMDDYFYVEGITTQDAATFSTESRGIADLGNWRRDNVNLLVHGIYDTVSTIKPWVKFGMSPRGIWKNGVPPGIIGANNYSEIYCDAVAWLQGRYIDYFSPQLYWKFGGSQDYALLEPWWATQLNGRIYCPSLAAYRIGTSTFGGAGEVAHQIRFYRDNANAQGCVPFTANNLTNNLGGIGDTLRTDLFRYPALVPTIPWKDTVAPNPPRALQYARIGDAGSPALVWDLPITAADGDSAARYAVYRFDHSPTLPGELSEVRNLLAVVGDRRYVPPTPPPGGPYYFAITALDRNFNEGAPSTVLQLVAPALPMLSSPANGTTGVPESVSVVWKREALASSYHLQGSIDSTFASPLFVNDSTLTDTTAIVRGYPGQVRLFWRVKSVNGAGKSVFSDPFAFTSGIPALAVLVDPPNVTVDIPLAPVFAWNKATGATSYRVQLALNANFSPSVMDSVVTNDTTLAAVPLDPFRIYFWRVKASNTIGGAAWTAYSRFRTVQVSGIAQEDGAPSTYALAQNYPNPFNPVTNITFAIPQTVRVRLAVFDLLGREVASLVDSELPPGAYTVQWDGSTAASGMYLCRMQAGDFVRINRMLLLR